MSFVWLLLELFRVDVFSIIEAPLVKYTQQSLTPVPPSLPLSIPPSLPPPLPVPSLLTHLSREHRCPQVPLQGRAQQRRLAPRHRPQEGLWYCLREGGKERRREGGKEEGLGAHVWGSDEMVRGRFFLSAEEGGGNAQRARRGMAEPGVKKST